MFSALLPVRGLCAGDALAMLVFQLIFKHPLPYCSATSKCRQLLATEICGNDDNEKWSVNYQGNPSGKYRSVRTAVPRQILSSAVSQLFVEKYAAWGSFLAKGLTNG